MTGRRLLLLAAIVFAFAAWIGFRLTAPPVPEASGGAEKPHARTYAPGARAELPRPPARAVPQAPTPPTAASPAAKAEDPSAEAPASPGLVDRREGAHKDGTAVMSDLQARLDVARADIEACVGEWTELDPGLAGQVNLGFSLDESGLTHVWVVDHSDVPFGPRSCFGTAIAAVDWAGITPEPVEVTLRFDFDAENPGG